jgi:uncharacterized membrane protein YphA (DoxX/SURF4 family)
MLKANNFWAMDGQARFLAVNAFFEHLGLIAGLVLVSIQALWSPRVINSSSTLPNRGFP